MIESQIKKLKINSTNIKSSLFKYNKELIKLKKDRVKLNALQQNRLKVGKKEGSIESSFKQSVSNIGRGLISYPMSLIDKFKEFFGLILLGILVNNLPKIIEGLQTIFGKIKDFLDKNPFIVSAIKFGFKVILDGIVGLAKVIKNLRPIIGGSFKFALDTLKSTKDQVGTLISMFSDYENTSVLLMQLVGLYDPPKPKPRKPSAAAIKKSKSTPTGGPKTGSVGPSYNPNTGYTYNPNFKNAAQATGVLAPKGGVMGTIIPGQKNTWRKYGPGEDPNVYKQNVERYKTLKPQGYAGGGTIGSFFSGLFGGGSKRGLGNIPPAEGTGRGSPSDIMRGKDVFTSIRTPYASPGGTAKGRKARQAINAFKMFEMNVDQENLNLQGREKSYDLFGEFTKQFKFLSDLRAKYQPEIQIPLDPNLPSLTPNEILEYEVKGAQLPSKYPGRGNRGARGEDSHGYPARDYQLPVGNAISVFVPGTVTYAGLDPSGYGNKIIIKHDNGKSTVYAHLSKINVNQGDRIEENESRIIGLTGGEAGAPGAGNSTGPHLHFELRNENGSPVTQYNDGDAFFRFGKVTKVRKRTQAEIDRLSNQNLTPSGKVLEGKASWYGPGFQGQETAYGEIFNTNSKEYTAASPPVDMGGLPYNTKVRVTNKTNGKSIIVRINDTGPYAVDANGNAIQPLRPHPTRILDLSNSAMKALGGSGVINIKAEIMKIDTSVKTKPIQNKITTQQLSSNIVELMGKLGETKKVFGNKNLSIEIKDGKLQIKDTRGILGTGLLQSNYDTSGSNIKLLEEIQNYLQYELNNQSSIQPIRKQGLASNAGSDLEDGYEVATIVNRTLVIKDTQLLPFPLNA